MPVERECVTLDDSHVLARCNDFSDRLGKPAVVLDRDDVGARVGQAERERAEPGADLDDMVGRLDAGEADDAPHRVRIDHEVLAERPPGRQAVCVEQRGRVLAGVGQRRPELPADLDGHRRVSSVGHLEEGVRVDDDDVVGSGSST